MGLLLLGTSRSPFFRMGVASASFHTPGNVLVVKEVLMMEMTEGSITGRQSLTTRTGILSTSGALRIAIELTIDSICLHSAALKANCSDVAYVLEVKEVLLSL